MESSTTRPDFEFETFSLAWYEYIFFGVTLAASMGIGIFYGFFGGKNRTNEEFLMAGRSMSVLPVTFSMICSFVSAITLLGNPVEVYFYGTQYTMMALTFIPMTLVLAYLYVPVFFELQLTSAYEYFEWRFSSKVRFTVSILAVIHLLFYMPNTIWGPSLALQQAAGINARLSAAIIFLVCIVYSSIGGLKAVLWTDALQGVVMVGSMLAVIGFGIIEAGGINHIWEVNVATDRVEWFNFDTDPRTRHTFWTCMVGGFFLWLPTFAATQASIQRYNSVPSLTAARKVLLFNMIGLMTVICLCSLIGITIYAKYALCDPIKTGQINTGDLLLPLFVMDVLRNYPGVPGLLVAGLTCGSLSTISSVLNSLTAIIVEDYVKVLRPNLTQIQLGWVSKIVSTITGLAAFSLVFVIAEVNETVQIAPFSALLYGSLLAPILGAFTLGIFFPWANATGTLLGLFTAMIVTAFFGIGSIFAGMGNKLPNQRLYLTDEGCNATFPGYVSDGNNLPREYWKNRDDPIEVQLWSLSYVWQPFVGWTTTTLSGLIYSVIINLWNSGEKASAKRPKVNHSLLSKPFLRLWTFCFGKEHLDGWVDYAASPYGLAGIKQRESIVAGLKTEDFQLHLGVNGNGNSAETKFPDNYENGIRL